MTYRLALITGATSGLGKALSCFLAKQGIPLFLTSRKGNDLRALQKELGALVPIEILEADLSNKNDVNTLLASISKETPDLVINNAGFGLYGDILTLPIEKQMQLLDVNLYALTQISIETARSLIQKKKRGTILNVSSTAGFFIYPSFALYSSSKAFVTHFSRSFDEEVRAKGVRVLVCCPGQIDTPFRTKASSKQQDVSIRIAMSTDTAVRLIWKQIQKQKQTTIIDLRYQIFYWIAKILPQRLIIRLLRAQIQKKI